MQTRNRLILLAVSYLLVTAFGVWLLTLPVLLSLLVGAVKRQAVLMTVGFGLVAAGALGLANVVKKF